jgi:intraflagellar transport protein 140
VCPAPDVTAAATAAAVDEYRNYEKALAALKEALKWAGRIKGEIRDARVLSLTGAGGCGMLEEAASLTRLASASSVPPGRISIVERFVTARKLAKTDTAGMVEICKQLLDQRDAETAIRVRALSWHRWSLSYSIATAAAGC